MMADATSSIFNKKATEKLRSPDDLDKFVQVTSPSVWVVLFACIALLVGLLAWGVFGAVETSVSTMGTVIAEDEDGSGKTTAVCFLTAEELEGVEEGNDADVGGVKMTVAEVQDVPMSAGEAKSLFLSDYLANSLVKADWVYAVAFEGDASKLPHDVPITIRITVKRIAPISLIFRSRG